MQKLLLMVAAFGVAAPATAQTTPQQPPLNTAAPAPQPKTVLKRVCQNVDVERSTGSRLSSTTKICKTVEVPAPLADNQRPADTGANDRH
jgi:serine protease inhibitor ecotin